MSRDRNAQRLTHVELASIDLTITAMQHAGVRFDDVSKDDNPREQMAAAWADLHHPLIELDERDQEIIAQIKSLAGELSSRTSLPELLTLRGDVLRGS